MLKRITLLLLNLCLLITFPAHSATSQDLSITTMLKESIPAVVNVRSEGKLPPTVTLLDSQKTPNEDDKTNDNEKPFMSLGSGVVIDKANGYIVTNAHVVKDADRVTVTLKDQRHFQAKVIGSDEPSDIAVLQISASQLSALPFADSNQLDIGQQVIAIGNPFGLDQSVTSGIISALSRGDLQIEGYENFIQIDAAINFGNSGGALVDTQGNLIGINTAILAPENGGSLGIGFAIPSNMVENVAKQLIQYGKVERGVIGVMVQTLNPIIAQALNKPNITGAIVTEISVNSSAEKAGIKIGDIITQINNAPVKSSNEVVNTVGFLRTGTKVNIQIIRDGQTLNFTPQVIDAEKQKQLNQEANPFLYGLSVQNFDLYDPTQGIIDGAAVLAVTPDSNAWSAGLRPGDVILSANNQEIQNAKNLENISKQADDALLLRVLRDQGAVFVAILKSDSVVITQE
jgi:serine protease Do